MMTVWHIHMGANRCSILDIDRKFARHFKQSRISVDNAFKICYRRHAKRRVRCSPARSTPDRGFCCSVCTAKIIKSQEISKNIQLFMTSSILWHFTRWHCMRHRNKKRGQFKMAHHLKNDKYYLTDVFILMDLLYSKGDIPVARLKYLPKNDCVGKFRS